MLILGKTPDNVLVVAAIDRSQKHSAQVVTEFGRLDALCDLDGQYSPGIVGQLTQIYRDPIQWEFIPRGYKYAFMDNIGTWTIAEDAPTLTETGWVYGGPAGSLRTIPLNTKDTIPWSSSLFKRPDRKEKGEPK